MNKTIANNENVEYFISALSDETQQTDCKELIDIMRTISGLEPVMWGSSIIGFGTMHYTYASGREGDWMKIGFSPRKGKISLYITGNAEKYATELQKLGKHKVGKGCIYINKLSDINIATLKQIITSAYTSEHYF